MDSKPDAVAKSPVKMPRGNGFPPVRPGEEFYLDSTLSSVGAVGGSSSGGSLVQGGSAVTFGDLPQGREYGVVICKVKGTKTTNFGMVPVEVQALDKKNGGMKKVGNATLCILEAVGGAALPKDMFVLGHPMMLVGFEATKED